MPESKPSAEMQRQPRRPPAEQQRDGANSHGRENGTRPPRSSRVSKLADMFDQARESPGESGDDADGEAPGTTSRQRSDTGRDSSNGREADTGTGKGESRSKPPTVLREVAERLGLQPEALYKIAIPLPSGKSMTLGQLKDAAVQQGDFSVRELEFEQRRTRQEGELLRTQEELREVFAALPEAARKPELMEKVRKKAEARLKVERERTLYVIPEWEHEERRTQDMAGMIEHLKTFGFPANYLEGVSDHRVVKYIRDMWILHDRVNKALEAAREEKPGAHSKANTSGRKPPQKDQRTQQHPRREARDHRSRVMNIFRNRSDDT
jgi:hypothetical protein